jgi:putative oxidoreductase
MKKFFFDCGTRDATASLGLLFLRVTIGLMIMIGHGIPKIQNFATIKDGFKVPDFFPLNLMSPPVSLMATIGAEVVAAAFIIVGFATRPAAFVLAFTMVVAAFNIHQADPFFGAAPSKELAIMFLIPSITILLSGAGLCSVDAKIHKEGRRRSKW